MVIITNCIIEQSRKPYCSKTYQNQLFYSESQQYFLYFTEHLEFIFFFKEKGVTLDNTHLCHPPSKKYLDTFIQQYELEKYIQYETLLTVPNQLLRKIAKNKLRGSDIKLKKLATLNFYSFDTP